MIEILDGNRVWLSVDDTWVGFMDFVPHENYNYCSFITIYEQFRRKGYATKLVDEFMAETKKPLQYSLTKGNSTGARFWVEYTRGKELKNIKGLTFEISVDK